MIAAKRKRVAVLISGRGSNMQALVTASQTPDFPAEIACVVSNRPDAAGLDWARSRGIATIAIDHKAYPDRVSFDQSVHDALVEAEIDLVALAGFMRILTPGFVQRWHGRMINIHPSLLPLFPGLYTHDRALEAGMKIAGCTVHFVTQEMDVGPIIAQAAVPILAQDDADRLAARVLTAEHELYPRALAWVASGAVSFDTADHLGYGSADCGQMLVSPS